MPKNIYPINQNQPGHYLAAMTILLQCSPTTTFVASPPFPSLLFYSFTHSFITYILHMCVRRTHFFSLIASSLPFYFTVFRVLFIHDISRCDVEANLRSLSYHISHLSPPPPSVLCWYLMYVHTRTPPRGIVYRELNTHPLLIILLIEKNNLNLFLLFTSILLQQNILLLLASFIGSRWPLKLAFTSHRQTLFLTQKCLLTFHC